MKGKKILSMIFAFALCLPCMFLLTACNKEIKDIKAELVPGKVFYVGETFKTDDFIIKSTYDNENPEKLSKEDLKNVTFEPAEATDENLTKVKVIFNKKHATVDVTVKAVELESLTVALKDNAVVYASDDETAIKGKITVSGKNNNGTDATITEYTVTIATDNKSFTVSVGEVKSEPQNMTAVKLKTLTVALKENEVVYVGDTVDEIKGKITVSGKNNNGTDATLVTDNLSFAIDTTTAGKKDLTVTYEVSDTKKFTTKVEVNVIAVELESISAVLASDYKIYVGDTFDSSQITVSGKNNNGTDATLVTDNLSFAIDTTTAGEHDLIVSATIGDVTKTANLKVNVEYGIKLENTVSTENVGIGNFVTATATITNKTARNYTGKIVMDFKDANNQNTNLGNGLYFGGFGGTENIVSKLEIVVLRTEGENEVEKTFVVMGEVGEGELSYDEENYNESDKLVAYNIYVTIPAVSTEPIELTAEAIAEKVGNYTINIWELNRENIATRIVEVVANSEECPINVVGGGDYPPLNYLIDHYATETETTYFKLNTDLKEDVVIPENKNVTLDLNGYKITNDSSDTIKNNGTLTITDSSVDIENPYGKGVVLNTETDNTATIFNEVGATLTIEAGQFLRKNDNDGAISGVDLIAEDTKDPTIKPEDKEKNTWYTFLNHGTATINGGYLFSDEDTSSLIDNGWFTPSQNANKVNSILTITGGTFEGGKYVKNDDYGIMAISGGTFKNANIGLLLNWNELTITGGTFIKGEKTTCVLNNGYTEKEAVKEFEKATATISGAVVEGFAEDQITRNGVAEGHYAGGTINGSFDLENSTLITSITVSGAKSEFAWGDEFSSEGLVVTKMMSKGNPIQADEKEYTIDSSKFEKGNANKDGFVITVTLRGSNLKATYTVKVIPEDLTFTETFPENVAVGEDFDLQIEIKNNGSEEYSGMLFINTMDTNEDLSLTFKEFDIESSVADRVIGENEFDLQFAVGRGNERVYLADPIEFESGDKFIGLHIFNAKISAGETVTLKAKGNASQARTYRLKVLSDNLVSENSSRYINASNKADMTLTSVDLGGGLTLSNSSKTTLSRIGNDFVVGGEIDHISADMKQALYPKNNVTHVVVLLIKFDQTKTVKKVTSGGTETKVWSNEEGDKPLSDIYTPEENKWERIIAANTSDTYNTTIEYTDGTKCIFTLKIDATLNELA